MKKFIFSILVAGLFLTGCAENEAADWKVDPTFTKDNAVLYGTEGKFGVTKANGETDEPEFPAGQGRLYHISFLEDGFSGQEYEINATYQDADESVKLYEGEIRDSDTQAKFGFDDAGLWKMEVTVDGEAYTDFVVEAQ